MHILPSGILLLKNLNYLTWTKIYGTKKLLTLPVTQPAPNH